MILIAEPVHFGATHMQVNSAFVALFKDVYPDQKIEVFAEIKHIQELKLNLKKHVAEIKFTSFNPYNNNPNFNWFSKIFGEWRQIFKLMLKAKKEKPELLVWLSLFPTGHFFWSLLHRLFLPQQKQIIILHGELVYLGPKKRRFSESLLRLFLKKSLLWSGPNTQYFVLGASIKENLSMLPDAILQKISVLQHPFLYPTEIKSPKNAYKPLKVCLFGALSIEKNAQFIFELAQSFAKEISLRQIQFATIGKMQANVQKYQNDLVYCYKPNEFLNPIEFEQQMGQNHVALFFYDNDSYSLIASGALHEALSLQIPVIALHNDYFAALMNQFPIGEMVGSLKEMESLIRALLLQPEQKLMGYQEAIIMFLQQNSFLLQSEKLKNILIRLGFLTLGSSASTHD